MRCVRTQSLAAHDGSYVDPHAITDCHYDPYTHCSDLNRHRVPHPADRHPNRDGYHDTNAIGYPDPSPSHRDRHAHSLPDAAPQRSMARSFRPARSSRRRAVLQR
jgi:hypothetical protein